MNVEKLKNLYSSCTDKYGAAQAMGTTYQTLYNIIYKGSVCKVDLLQRIAQYFKVPVGYFFDEDAEMPESASPTEDLLSMLEALQKENTLLKEELERLKSIKIPTKDSKVYNIWMKFMEITEEMQEMYNEEKKR